MTWNPLDSPIDYVVIAGQRTPGLAVVEGAGSPRKWDKRRSYGHSGATLVFKSIDLDKFTIRITLVTPEEWEAWDLFSPVVARPPQGQQAHALDVEHPLLDQVGIKSMVVENVSQAEQKGPGEWEITISCIEFRAPRPALSRPTGSRNRPTTTDPVDAEIELLTRQVQVLAS